MVHFPHAVEKCTVWAVHFVQKDITISECVYV